jgi:hypothetical protein
VKNNPIDDIVKCNIDISSPISGDESFGNILVVVPGPKADEDSSVKGTVKISKVEELKEYGYTEEEDAYIAADVAFSQNPSPSYLYLCIRTKSEETYENIEDTLNRANSECGFYGVCLIAYDDPNDIKLAAKWVEAHEKLFGFSYTDIDSCPVTETTYYRTFGLFSGKADGYEAGSQPKENQFAALALMAKCFGYAPGSETWHLKEIADITPSVLSSEEKSKLEKANINKYLTYAGSNVTIGGMVLAGEWIDVIRFRDWLKNQMQTRVFRVMKTNRKVPFLDTGIGLIEGAIEATLLEGQTVGGIAPSEYDEDGNEVPGFTVKVPRATDFTEAERKSRKITGFRYSAKLSGAIHLVEINGYLTF